MPVRLYKSPAAVVFAVGLSCVVGAPVRADTLNGSLAAAYINNPQLNAQRAAARAIDENVGIALAGYRPRLALSGSTGEQFLDQRTRVTTAAGSTIAATTATFPVSSLGGTLTQPLYNGFLTASRTRQAEAQVLAARETLRSTEQTVLLNAVGAYMDLLRTAALLELQRNNVRLLQSTLRQTQDRFNVGEITRTDVAQAESALATARADMQLAEGNYVFARATYRQIIGVEAGRLTPGMPVDRFLPKTREAGIQQGRISHPLVLTANYNVDAALDNVKIAESALSPTLNFQATAARNFGVATSAALINSTSASAALVATVPIYQGGSEYATIRQAKETLGQRRLDLDTQREQIQATVTQAYGALDTARAQVESTNAAVRAAEIAFNGVSEEARVGQRTTLDVLNAQQLLIRARSTLITAQRDRVVQSYTVLAATGRLSPQVLGLAVPNYDPIVHYTQVRDAWSGVRTPDGR